VNTGFLQKRPGLAAAALLAVLTFAAYAPVLWCDFIRLDDGYYVVRNPRVTGGLTAANVAWAFQTGYQGNWHPVTWISHMVDATLFGVHPWGHHLTSLLLHVANAVLLFQWLRGVTGAMGRSWMVAALFALHPFHVESVAWVAERKDVLSTFFFMLMLLSYSRYAGASVDTPPDRGGLTGRWGSYALALAFLALGLMSKPMLVTAPFVLLLVDYWPLGRVGLRGMAALPRLVAEKVPFFLLAAISSVITFRVQHAGGAATLALPWESRVMNAVASYAKYLTKTVRPLGLAVFYPHPDIRYPISHQWSAGAVVVAAIALVAVSVWVVSRRGLSPWVAVGWFWFGGTLVPVIGLVQVGLHGYADRYTYIPLIGLFIAAVWEVGGRWDAWFPGGESDSGAAWPVAGWTEGLPRDWAAIALCSVILAGWGGLTFRQTTFWRTDLLLFQHALAVTGDTAMAHFHVGTGLADLGQFAEAKAHFQEAVTDDPGFGHPYLSLGIFAEAEGRPADAVTNYTRAMELMPDWPEPPNSLASLLATSPQAAIRNGPRAVTLARRACDLTAWKEPRFLATLDAAYAEAGMFEEAIQTARKGRDLAAAAGNRSLVAGAEARLALYAKKQPYHQP